jgi:hypothetical protein
MYRNFGVIDASVKKRARNNYRERKEDKRLGSAHHAIEFS